MGKRKHEYSKFYIGILLIVSGIIIALAMLVTELINIYEICKY